MDLDTESINYLNETFPLEHPKAFQGEGSLRLLKQIF